MNQATLFLNCFSKKFNKKLFYIGIGFLAVVLTSCETLSYYGQAAKGQAYIITHRASIDSLINNDSTDPVLKTKLRTILSIRRFAAEELFLPVQNNYSTYVDIEKSFVVWNVFAAPEFSMTPINWCYPIAGCVSYRGYFNEEPAQKFANKMRQNNNQDVYVGGVAAYSTLGWFADSILNTVIERDDYQLASLLFHELAHQVLYIPGETEFNESFATAVEQEGVQRWLKKTQVNNQTLSVISAQAELDRARQEEFVEMITATVASLQELYSSGLDQEKMRTDKQIIINKLRSNYIQLKAHWEGYTGYDNWFKRDLNNAQLNTVSTYNQWVPAFKAMLVEEQGNLENFYARVLELQKLSPELRSFTMEYMLK